MKAWKALVTILIALTIASPLVTALNTDTVLLVPFYVYPGCQWNELMQIKADHPRINITVVVNPASGPGTAKDDTYATYIGKLQDSGIEVLGYVWTDYGNRNAGEVKAEVDDWMNWYGVDGIFFDGVNLSSGAETYYQSIVDYLKTNYGSSKIAVGNSGYFDEETISNYTSIFDVLIIYENPSWPSGTWYPPNVDRAKLGALVYNVSFDGNSFASMTDYVKYVYVTDDTDPNPWDSLASYFIDEVVSITGEEKTDYVLHIYSSDSTSYSVAEHYVSYNLSSGSYNLTYVSTVRNWEENSGLVQVMGVVVNDSGSEKALYFAWGNGWNGTTLYACYDSDCADTDYTDFNSTWHALAIEVGSDYAKLYVDGTLLRTVSGLSVSEVLRVDAGSFDNTPAYDLYIDNITEVRGNEVQKESFDDNYDCFFTTHVGDVELVSIQQVPFFHSVLVVAGLLILVAVGVGRR